MSTTRFYSSYISWAITNGLRDNNINPLDGAGAEWVKDFVDNTKKIHYSHTEFLSLLDEMKNGQDQSFLFMIYEGIMGERFSELRELTFSDIDFINKKVFVRERNESVSISDECIYYLKKTREEDTYEQYNAKNNQYTTKKLLASDYIFKNIESPRGKENEPVKMNVIYNRLHSLKEIFNLEYLTPNAIKQSGMIHMAVELFKRDNVVAYDQFAEIGKKYNFSQITNNNHTYYNSYLMRNFITEDNVKNLYEMDIIIEKR
jgi:integrase